MTTIFSLWENEFTKCNLQIGDNFVLASVWMYNTNAAIFKQVKMNFSSANDGPFFYASICYVYNLAIMIQKCIWKLHFQNDDHFAIATYQHLYFVNHWAMRYKTDQFNLL